jgi:replicative DNA helicase
MRKSDVSSYIPPQDIQLEIAVLGALILYSDSYEQVSNILRSEVFYKSDHATIYKAIETLHKDKAKVDLLTVTAQLRKTNELDDVGGAYAVTILTQSIMSSAHIEYHARILVEKYLSREVIRIAHSYQATAFKDEEDVFEMMDEMAKELELLRNYTADEEADKPLAISLQERGEEKRRMVREGLISSGIPTGNKKVDKVIGGWVKQNLIILAARPSMGKSVKAMNYAKQAAQSSEPVLFFSLEMSTQELIDRFIVEEARIPLHDYRANNLTDYDLDKIDVAVKALKKLPIQIVDKASINPRFIRKKAKQYIKSHGKLGMIIIDYLQLMTPSEKTNNREQEVASVSRELKAIAKELDIPVMALAQVARSVTQSVDKRPDLSHLRESGSIEQDADVVMAIYRPSYYFEYGQHPDGKDSSGKYNQDNIGQTEYEQASELLILKNRNGVAFGAIDEKFIGMYSTFKSAEEASEPIYQDNSDIIPFDNDPF